MAQVDVRLDAPARFAPFDVSAVAVARSLAGALSAAAAVIHLVLVPSHIDEWFVEGLAFAVVGWLQLALGVALVVQPRRWVLASLVALHAVVIGLWLWSRTSGFPVGPHQGHAATVELIDATTVAFQALAIVVCVGLLVRGVRTGDRLGQVGLGVLLVPFGVVALTTAVLASPSARNHAHESHVDTATGEAHGHDAAPSEAASGAHGHGEGATTPVADQAHADGHGAGTDAAGHGHGGAPAAGADDKGFAQLSNGHQEHGDHGPVPMDAETTALLAAQLADTAPLVAAYPTVASAEAAGFRRSGPFSPGLGAHYGLNGGGARPEVIGAIRGTGLAAPLLIYNGTEPDSRLIGFMYLSGAGTGAVPEGFAGENDVWHKHAGVCIKLLDDGSLNALAADDAEVTGADCEAQDAFFIEDTGYMVHVWNVPGWENPLGVFNELHPGITCPDGTFYSRNVDDPGTEFTTCRS